MAAAKLAHEHRTMRARFRIELDEECADTDLNLAATVEYERRAATAGLSADSVSFISLHVTGTSYDEIRHEIVVDYVAMFEVTS